MKEVDKKNEEDRQTRNPVLTQPTEIGGIIFPKNTHLESYDADYHRFRLAIFDKFFQFRGFEITHLYNYNGGKNVDVKFAKPTTIQDFICQANTRVRLEFDKNNIWVSDCILDKDYTRKGFLWKKGTSINYLKTIVQIDGVASFTLDGHQYNEELNYYDKLKENWIRFYSKKTHKLLFDSGILTSKKSNSRQYVLQAQLYPKYKYKIINTTTNQVYTGITDESGLAQKIVTDKEVKYYYEIFPIIEK
ncbi:hypothetical protein A6B44_03520 [Pasteurella skyensis]|nr:hypothetical protein A6B44_03520 [Pasteurella skyensis]SEM41450.1 hypothetical protein SAMN05444853_11651 [Pasteurella skyensis]